jgi:ceramide glucosyltransferase
MGQIILGLLAAVAIGYQLFAILACIFFKNAVSSAGSPTPGLAPVSVLKPVRGLDPAFREAIRSHTVLHGEYEFLCGVRDLNDPAAEVLRSFANVRIVHAESITPNGKVGALIDLARASRYPILVVNDSDIRVEPDYLERVTAPLADPSIGLVTCLYRAVGDTFAARFEGLGVSTDFAPSTLVARLVGVDEFAMGSTLAFRRTDLDRIGGFQSIADFLADDYQLGRRIHSLGLKCVLSDVIVETHLGGGWRDVWAHQLRWARTIRVTKFAGNLGLPITNASLWAVVEASFGQWHLALGLILVRLAMALTSGWYVMRSRETLRLMFLVPLRDVFSFAIWVTALFGHTVEWRGLRLPLDREGRIR